MWLHGENGPCILRWFRRFGLSSGRQRLTSSPQKTTLGQLISQCSEMHWPTTGPALAYMPMYLPARVRNTILEARAPSTRILYTLKWSVFRDWCSARSLDLAFCDLSHVLTFLKELLDKGPLPHKVYVAAIAANHSLEAG